MGAEEEEGEGGGSCESNRFKGSPVYRRLGIARPMLCSLRLDERRCSLPLRGAAQRFVAELGLHGAVVACDRNLGALRVEGAAVGLVRHALHQQRPAPRLCVHLEKRKRERWEVAMNGGRGLGAPAL